MPANSIQEHVKGITDRLRQVPGFHSLWFRTDQGVETVYLGVSRVDKEVEKSVAKLMDKYPYRLVALPMAEAQSL